MEFIRSYLRGGSMLTLKESARRSSAQVGWGAAAQTATGAGQPATVLCLFAWLVLSLCAPGVRFWGLRRLSSAARVPTAIRFPLPSSPSSLTKQCLQCLPVHLLQMAKDPITIIIALDRAGKAAGELYVDDGRSFAFQVSTGHGCGGCGGCGSCGGCGGCGGGLGLL